MTLVRDKQGDFTHNSEYKLNQDHGNGFVLESE
jgi:hypothetical protein